MQCFEDFRTQPDEPVDSNPKSEEFSFFLEKVSHVVVCKTFVLRLARFIDTK